MATNTGSTPDDNAEQEQPQVENMLPETRREARSVYEQVFEDLDRISVKSRTQIAELLGIKLDDLSKEWRRNREGFRDRAVDTLVASGVGVHKLIETETRTGIWNALRGNRRLPDQMQVNGIQLNNLVRNPNSTDAQMIEYLYNHVFANNQAALNPVFERVTNNAQLTNLRILMQIRAVYDQIRGEEYRGIGTRAPLTPGTGGRIEAQMDIVHDNETHRNTILSGMPPTPQVAMAYRQQHQEEIKEHTDNINVARKEIQTLEGRRRELGQRLRDIQRLSGGLITASGQPAVHYTFAPDHAENFQGGATIVAGCGANTNLTFAGQDHPIGDWLANDDLRSRADRYMRYQAVAGANGRLDARDVLNELIRTQYSGMNLEPERRDQLVQEMQNVILADKSAADALQKKAESEEKGEEKKGEGATDTEEKKPEATANVGTEAAAAGAAAVEQPKKRGFFGRIKDFFTKRPQLAATAPGAKPKKGIVRRAGGAVYDFFTKRPAIPEGESPYVRPVESFIDFFTKRDGGAGPRSNEPPPS